MANRYVYRDKARHPRGSGLSRIRTVFGHDLCNLCHRNAIMCWGDSVRGPFQLSAAFLPLSVLFRDSMTALNGSTIVDGPEVYEDRDPAQREAEGPRASMDYSEFTPKKQIERARIRAIHESNCTSVTRTCQRTPPTVCCWTSPSPSPSPSPSRGYSLINDPSGLRAS